jgi:hypothetical protein
MLPNALWMTGQNSSAIASVVIEPTNLFDQNTFMSPPEPIIDSRKASSARLPSTSANVNGARGMPIEDITDYAEAQHQPDVLTKSTLSESAQTIVVSDNFYHYEKLILKSF